MIAGVVVPTFGRRALLEECLVSLAGQDPKPAFVIVVDGNERPVAEKAAAIHGFAVIRESNRGPAHARNAGYLHARATSGWKGRKAAWLALIGFVSLLVTYYAVNLFIVGLHSYARG